MSLFVWIFARSMARMIASITASDRASSPTPGAARRVPVRFTFTSVPAGKTVSRCAAMAMSGPPPVPLRRPITLPAASRSTFVRLVVASSFWYAWPRASSLKGGAGISVSVMMSATIWSCVRSSSVAAA